jgi:DNA-directed RNA polymerase subunit RPC12/RpoP
MCQNAQGEFVCPACGENATHHAKRNEQLAAPTTPHQWTVAGDRRDVVTLQGQPLDTPWWTLYRCRACGATVEVPLGTTGEMLRSYQRGACPGVRP